MSDQTEDYEQEDNEENAIDPDFPLNRRETIIGSIGAIGSAVGLGIGANSGSENQLSETQNQYSLDEGQSWSYTHEDPASTASYEGELDQVLSEDAARITINGENYVVSPQESRATSLEGEGDLYLQLIGANPEAGEASITARFEQDQNSFLEHFGL